MLPCTRPSPGKCLAVGATPWAAIPVANASPCPATEPGVKPYSRPYTPIGAFRRAAPGLGTVSSTGARFMFTPARRSCRAHRPAAFRSRPGLHDPCSTAEGIRARPVPCSTCTAPPSWSVATSSRAPAVACPVRACIPATTRAVAEPPSWLRPVRMTLPRW